MFKLLPSRTYTIFQLSLHRQDIRLDGTLNGTDAGNPVVCCISLSIQEHESHSDWEVALLIYHMDNTWAE